MAGYSFEKYKPTGKKSKGRSSRGGRSGSRGSSRGSSGGSSRGRPSASSRGRDSGRSRSSGSRSGSSRSGGSRGRSESRGREFRGRDSKSDYKRKDNRNSGRTQVSCSGCGADCFVPFKPMTDKPLFCDNCFSKDSKPKKRGRDESPKSSGISEHQLDIINEKLNKIMKALNLE